MPELKYTTDNGAMIAMAGALNFIDGKITNDLTLNAKANLNIED